MFSRILSTLTRTPRPDVDWDALHDAGYHDVPRHVSRSHARDSAARESLGLHTFGHLR